MAKRMSVPRSNKEAAQMERAEAASVGYSTWAVFANEDGDWQFYYEYEGDD